MKTVIRLTKNDMKRIINETIKSVKKNIIHTTINEGLITSYDMDKCKSYLLNTFPNIIRIVSLKDNPYIQHGHRELPEYNDFVGIVLEGNNYSNYSDIITTANNLLGWFTGYIDIKVKVKSGFIPYRFYNYNGDFVHTAKNGKEIKLEDLLTNKPELFQFSIIVEAKFSEIYQQKTHEVFYHATEVEKLPKIFQQGLVPKSLGNFPERVYLGKSIQEILNMVGDNLNNIAILKVDVSNLKLYKLYRDQRNPTAVFTYNNIPPSQLSLVEE